MLAADELDNSTMNAYVGPDGQIMCQLFYGSGQDTVEGHPASPFELVVI